MALVANMVGNRGRAKRNALAKASARFQAISSVLLLARMLLVGRLMPRRLSALFLSSILSMVLVAACDTKPVTPLPVGSTKQETLDGKRLEELPMVLVLAVDDAATSEAAQLRARVAESVRVGLLSTRDERWNGSCSNKDPAAWHPGDVRVVLVRPSAPDSAELLSPVDMPSLAWITKTSTKEEVELIAAGTGEALEKRLAGPGELYRPLHAMKRALELVTRARAPQGEAEAALMASLPGEVIVQAIIASARDDGDANTLASLGLKIDELPRHDIVSIAIAGPFTSTNDVCWVDEAGTSRLEAWGREEDADLIALPCDTSPALPLVIVGSADCFTECHERQLDIAPDGTTDCRAFVDQTDLERCNPERGHRDPDGKPELVERQGQTLRRCEVNQLTGAALEACRSSLACPDCPSGFCATEVPELSHAQECKQGEHDWPLRFTGEALDAPGDWIHLVCNTVPSDG
jgi:hypothetical protein